MLGLRVQRVASLHASTRPPPKHSPRSLGRRFVLDWQVHLSKHHRSIKPSVAKVTDAFVGKREAQGWDQVRSIPSTRVLPAAPERQRKRDAGPGGSPVLGVFDIR